MAERKRSHHAEAHQRFVRVPLLAGGKRQRGGLGGL